MAQRKKFYSVSYDGMYMGGIAIVVATSPDEAIELVRNHPQTVNFDSKQVPPYVTEIKGPVLYNDTGDY